MRLIEKKSSDSVGFNKTKTIHLGLFTLISIATLTYLLSYRIDSNNHHNPDLLATTSSNCPILDYVRPASFNENNSTVVKIISDETFRNQSALKLSGAVKIKTDTYDDSPLLKDDPTYWEDKFAPFHNYLSKTFPKAWDFLKIETVNNWGLLLTWQGSDESLKPVILAAHQDVVPIQDATLKDWTYPPYDGVYDGQKLWGRGSSDCKNLLVGHLESAELLFDNGFKPKRTIIYSFGFDEEIGGVNGAKELGKVLLERYGKDSIYALIDEGGQSLIKESDVHVALPGTGEKGSINVNVALNTPGGHSSVPPDHTSIGILSEFIESVENHPFKSIFSSKNPTFHEYQCIATYSPTLESSVKSAILKSGYDVKSNEIAIDFLRQSSLTNRYLISTSSAVDIIHGGAKSNALPEYVEAVINHRVAVESTVKETLDSDKSLIFKIAQKYDLGVIENGKELKPKTPKGFFTISFDQTLEPAPLTPVNDDHWKIFGGIIRHIYEEVAFINKDQNPFKNTPIVVAPGMATGNTDTRYYWDLTKHIYRYRPGIGTTVTESHAHGVDENISFDSHLQIIAFYYEYLQVVNELTD